MQASKTVGGQYQKVRRAEDHQYRVNTNNDEHGSYDVTLNKGQTSGVVQIPAFTPNRQKDLTSNKENSSRPSLLEYLKHYGHEHTKKYHHNWVTLSDKYDQ